jgi:hypothetical protein
MVQPSPEYVEKKGSRLRAVTPVGIVEGCFHHAPGARLSDAIRNLSPGERYMALTDLTVRPFGSSDADVVEQAAFGLLNLEQVAMIVPLEG